MPRSVHSSCHRFAQSEIFTAQFSAEKLSPNWHWKCFSESRERAKTKVFNYTNGIRCCSTRCNWLIKARCNRGMCSDEVVVFGSWMPIGWMWLCLVQLFRWAIFMHKAVNPDEEKSFDYPAPQAINHRCFFLLSTGRNSSSGIPSLSFDFHFRAIRKSAIWSRLGCKHSRVIIIATPVGAGRVEIYCKESSFKFNLRRAIKQRTNRATSTRCSSWPRSIFSGWNSEHCLNDLFALQARALKTKVSTWWILIWLITACYAAFARKASTNVATMLLSGCVKKSPTNAVEKLIFALFRSEIFTRTKLSGNVRQQHEQQINQLDKQECPAIR